MFCLYVKYVYFVNIFPMCNLSKGHVTQEVSGSIPLISTKILDLFGNQGFFLLLQLAKCDFLRFSPKGKC